VVVFLLADHGVPELAVPKVKVEREPYRGQPGGKRPPVLPLSPLVLFSLFRLLDLLSVAAPLTLARRGGFPDLARARRQCSGARRPRPRALFSDRGRILRKMKGLFAKRPLHARSRPSTCPNRRPRAASDVDALPGLGIGQVP
jgi:hypothetical protein